jgi:hypothetical protein
MISMSLFAGVSSGAEGSISATDSDESRTPRATSFDYYESITTTVQIDAGERFYVYFDNGSLELKAMPPVELATECTQALTLAPAWLRDNLTYKFRQLNSNQQKTFANLIINSPDSRYIDEIAFCIAHSSVEALQNQYMFPQLFTNNAKYIYQNDQYLDYVEIVEKTDYTTLSYKNQTNVSFELPRDIYYWYVVHPKISDELPTYVDPDYDYTRQSPNNRNYGVAPPNGKFWREWFFYNNDSANYSGNNKPNPLLKNLLENKYTLW